MLSGATDLEKLKEPEDLTEPMRWLWRALAPRIDEMESAGVATGEYEGRPVPVAHGGDGFHGHDLGPGRHEQPGELPGAGRQVEDPGAGPDGPVADDVGDGLGGVRGPGGLVGVGVGRGGPAVPDALDHGTVLRRDGT